MKCSAGPSLEFGLAWRGAVPVVSNEAKPMVDARALAVAVRYCGDRIAGVRRHVPQRRREMILATTKVEDFDRFLKIFSTKGAEKRKQHGSKGSHVFRDPNEDDRVWVLFDWDAEGWQSFVSDPEVPPIIQEAGHKGLPQAAEPGGQYDA
jgi:hypothetical protein